MKNFVRLLTLAVALNWIGTCTRAAEAQSVPGQPFVVEYYYKTKWGHADEFLQLFKKNHYPLLKKEVEMGRLLKVWMDQPRYHTTEDGRWDYRVTIVFKNATVANEPFDEDALKKQLIPRQRNLRPRRTAPLRNPRRPLGPPHKDDGFGSKVRPLVIGRWSLVAGIGQRPTPTAPTTGRFCSIGLIKIWNELLKPPH
jgi:hypothetical protein